METTIHNAFLIFRTVKSRVFWPVSYFIRPLVSGLEKSVTVVSTVLPHDGSRYPEETQTRRVYYSERNLMRFWYFLPSLMKNALGLAQHSVQKGIGRAVEGRGAALRDPLAQCLRLTTFRAGREGLQGCPEPKSRPLDQPSPFCRF